jgi:glycosyltransferase involved in cell wall biosynthesis
VSPAQQATWPSHPHVLPPIENGVPVEARALPHAKRHFALMLARICPEKGVHLAIEAAKRADIPLLLAGDVFPYRAHQRYFVHEVAPRLDRWRRFIGPADAARRRRLLAAAQCLLVPSLSPETSSLAAREALAAGTPVIAFPVGALADTIEHGRTGFLVRDVGEMARAIAAAPSIDPQTCRRMACERFSLDRMVQAYFRTYAALARGCVASEIGAVA